MKRFFLLVFWSTLTTHGFCQLNSDGYYNHGISNLDTGAYEWAISDFSTAIRLDSTQCDAYLARAEARYYLGDTLGALKDVELVIARKGDKLIEAYFQRAWFKEDLYDKQGAIEDYSTVIKLSHGSFNLAYANRANMKNRVEDFEGAISDCNKAILRNHKDYFAFLNRGEARVKLGDLKKGCRDLIKAQSKDPSKWGEFLIKEYCK